jgi:cytochrome c oxidase subunit 3
MQPAAANGAADDWRLPYAGRVGMLSLIGAEAAIFVIFIVAYLFYLGKSVGGPTPAILHPPIVLSVCLLSSSITMELALGGLRRGRSARFGGWWLLTIVLGAVFLVGTLVEWRHLIVDEGLTVHTNLFGTTFYSLVGLHGLHVIIGVTLMTVVALLWAGRRLADAHVPKVEVLSMYWHFVDAVWVVVFTVVYLVGR